MPACHKVTEVYPNLLLGKESQLQDMVEQGVTVLAPLASLSGSVWSTGWRGRIYYLPIKDYSVPPVDVALKGAWDIIQLLKDGEKVGLFCVGGHGRTGFMATLILGLLQYKEDPLTYLRKEYCDQIVESKDQVLYLQIMLEGFVKEKLLEQWEVRESKYKRGKGGKGSGGVKVYYPGYGGYYGGSSQQEQITDEYCPSCHRHLLWESERDGLGICALCAYEYGAKGKQKTTQKTTQETLCVICGNKLETTNERRLQTCTTCRKLGSDSGFCVLCNTKLYDVEVKDGVCTDCKEVLLQSDNI